VLALGAHLRPWRAQGAIVRSVPWPLVSAVLGLATAPAVVAAIHGAEHVDAAVLTWLVVAAAAGAFAYDEPPRAVLAATPTTLARRVLVRFVLVVGAAAFSGLVVGVLTGLDGVALHEARAQLPAAAAVLALSGAAAAVAHRRGAPCVALGAVSAGPLAALVVSGLARQYPWLPTLTATRSAGRWWFLALAAGAVVAKATREPYRR
jgi:hypothetical protein